MPFAEDLSPFFNTSEFATAATLAGNPVQVIFDRAYLEPLGPDMEGTGPAATLPTADTAGVAHGAELVIGATTYKVRGIEPDGTGVTVLRLEVQ